MMSIFLHGHRFWLIGSIKFPVPQMAIVEKILKFSLQTYRILKMIYQWTCRSTAPGHARMETSLMENQREEAMDNDTSKVMKL